MALFGLGYATAQSPEVLGDGVLLRAARSGDFDQWASLRARSRAFLTPWEPVWPEDDLTPAAFRRRVRRNLEEIENEEAFAFLLFREADKRLVGGLTLGHIRRGVAQTATLGYWMGVPYAGKGLMSRAVRAALVFAFGQLHLHRIEAACLPHNEASMRLLSATGFEREGLARAYLRINGHWQDHVLYGQVARNP